jgi:hypothetical protein
MNLDAAAVGPKRQSARQIMQSWSQSLSNQKIGAFSIVADFLGMFAQRSGNCEKSGPNWAHSTYLLRPNGNSLVF